MEAGLEPIDVEELLVWTYRRQRADVVVGRGLGLQVGERLVDGQNVQASSACGCAAVGRIQELGVRVDGTGGCDALHEDAEVVHQVVGRLDGPLQGLVIQHARDGSRPDVMLGAVPRPRPVIGPKGVPRVRYEPWDRHRHYGWFPMEWSVSLVAIEAARLEYGMWRAAIGRVAATLRVEGRLTRHWVTGPAAQVQPWAIDTLDIAHEP